MADDERDEEALAAAAPAAAAAAAAVARSKGFSFKSSKVKSAPPELRIVATTSEPAALQPGPVTTGFKAAAGEAPARAVAARGMFATAAAVPKPKPATAAATAAKAKPAAATTTATKKTVVTDAPAAAAAAAAAEPPLTDLLADVEDVDLKEMAALIRQEETCNLYSSEVPETYVPQTRRGFSEFIKTTFRTFELPEGAITIPEGDKYFPYQKFVRDYMRMEAPYRGILVYHGLGSGKTCTSIATAEALFASAHKKVIVMANRSLKKNFFNEISKCGFRHFQLNNYWMPLDPKEESTVLFANQILGLSAKYIKAARQIWVPDFRKPQSETNYGELEDDDRQEIRRQILNVLEWDKEKNPTGRIRFIAYNGITAKKLLAMACDPAEEKFFDNAVIVIDEVHNMIRNMQGKIEPYFRNMPGHRKAARLIQVEPVKATPRWKPTICDPESKLYNRGYLFYRLLVEARNSKIVALSGTPMINFPEEMAILANVLHGYIYMVQGNIRQSGPTVKGLIEDVGHRHPYIDFIEATINKQGGGYNVMMTFLQPGMRKLDHERGVMRIPPEEHAPSFEEVVKSVQDAFRAANLPFAGEMSYSAEPLLPPYNADFREKFISGTASIKNNMVLMARLSGLISYYKGSQLELMPRVIKDEVVRVPFSLYSMKAYQARRGAEVEREIEEMGKQKTDLNKVWAKIYQLGGSKSNNNYKMGSRQACNFAFPASVVRPAPANARERKEEAEAGGAVVERGLADDENEAGAEEAEQELPAAGLEFEGAAEGEGDEEAAAKEEEEILAETGLAEDGEEEADAAARDAQGGGGWWDEEEGMEEEDGSDDEAADFEEELDGSDEEEGEEEEGEEEGGEEEGGEEEYEEEPEEELDEEAEEESNTNESFVDALMEGGAKEKKQKDLAERLVEGVVEATVGAPKPDKKGLPPPKKTVRFDNGAAAAAAAAAPAPVKSKSKQAAAAAAASSASSSASSTAERIEFSNTLDNDYEVFSFFAETPFTIDDVEYPTLEHYYQSQKYVGADDAWAKKIRRASTPQKAKDLGRDDDHEEREDFRENKDEIVLAGLRAKFEQNEEPMSLLMVSGDAEIVDVNPRDKYWGLGKAGDGQNRLGELIMQLRDELVAAEKREAKVSEAIEILKPAPKPKTVVKTVKPKSAAAAAAAPPDTGNCKAGRMPGEIYKDACARAKRCLATVAADALRLGGPDGLESHSPKYAAILTRIQEAPGSSLVYSQFLDMEGIGILRVAMDVNGYAPIEIIQTGSTFAFSPRTEESFRRGSGSGGAAGAAFQPRYITFSGGEDPKVRGLALDLFNARFSELTEPMMKVLTEAGYTDNKTGQICRVFCITSAGAEGLSLRNVRAVHIMEPYWNEVRLRQVKGRAIRIGSHLDLPEDQRNVAIYTYVSMFPEQSQRKGAGEFTIDEAILTHDSFPRETIEQAGIPVPAGANTYTITTDEMIYMISERKRKIIENLEGVMKAAAVDCTLNQEQNMEGDDSYQCFVVRGKVGDFLYHPVLEDDIREASKLVLKKAGEDQGAAPQDGVTGTLALASAPPAAERKTLLPAVRTVAPPAAPAVATRPVPPKPAAPLPPKTVVDARAKAAAAREAAAQEAIKREEERKVKTAAKTAEKKAAKKAAEEEEAAAQEANLALLEEQLRAFYKEVKAPALKIAKAKEIAKKYNDTIWKALEDKGEYPAEIVAKYKGAYQAGKR
jgi:hypothetical protein